MSSKLKKLKILLDRGDEPTFSPGNVITGRVIVDVDAPKTIRSLKVTIKGKAAVIFRDSIGSGRNKKIVHFTGEELYFSIDFFMLGQADTGSVTIEAGSHEYPFLFRLPNGIPSTFETSCGSVKYKVKAIMDVPWESEYKTSQDFTVDTPYDLTKCTNIMTGIEDEEYATLCCCAIFDSGAMKINIFLPTNGCTIGESIQARINVNNTLTSGDVTKVKLQIEQITKLHSRSPHVKTKTFSEIVNKTINRGPFGKRDEIVVGIEVPKLPYSSMMYCNLIDVQYNLRTIITVSGCHCDIDKTFPIVIGTIPALSSESSVENLTMIPAPVSTAPIIVPPESPTDMGTIPMPMPMPMPMPVQPEAPPMPVEFIPMPMPYSSHEQFSRSTRDEHDASYNFIPGNQPYPPVPFGSGTSNRAQASTSIGSTVEPPPSYNEAMGMYAKH